MRAALPSVATSDCQPGSTKWQLRTANVLPAAACEPRQQPRVASTVAPSGICTRIAGFLSPSSAPNSHHVLAKDAHVRHSSSLESLYEAGLNMSPFGIEAPSFGWADSSEATTKPYTAGTTSISADRNATKPITPLAACGYGRSLDSGWLLVGRSVFGAIAVI